MLQEMQKAHNIILGEIPVSENVWKGRLSRQIYSHRENTQWKDNVT